MKRWTSLAAAALVVVAILGAVFGLVRRTGDGGRLPRVVKVEGGAACVNMSLSGPSWIAGGVEGRPAYVLARDGDLLLTLGKDEADMALPYRESDGASLRVEIACPRLLLDGATVSVQVWKAADWSWLEKAGRSDLAGLRILEIRGEVEEAHVPVLEKLAEANPTVGLMLGTGAVLRRALPLFHPRLLVLNEPLSEADVEIIKSRRGLRYLWLQPGGESPRSLAFLDDMLDLRRLVLDGWAPEKTGPLPEGCRRLRSLKVTSSTMKDLSALGDLAGLRELILAGCESLEDVSALPRLTALESLDLSSCKRVANLSVLKDLPRLTRLGLPTDITQDEFASLMRDLPRLRALELVECEGVTDLAPLKGLSRLEHLVVLGPKADLAPLRDMKGLRYLVLSAKEVFEKTPDEVKTLEAALPLCTVASGDPFCLGTGWLLALFPAAAAAGFLVRRRRARNPLPGWRNA